MVKRAVSVEEEVRSIKSETRVLKSFRTKDHDDMVRRMQSMKETYDVLFVVGDQRFPAHRVWVSAASSVLRKLLYQGINEEEWRVVFVLKFNPYTWRKVLSFIYSKDCNIS